MGVRPDLNPDLGRVRLSGVGGRRVQPADPRLGAGRSHAHRAAAGGTGAGGVDPSAASARRAGASRRRRRSNRIQPVVATLPCWANRSCSLKTSAGVCQSRVLRGRLLSAAATASSSSRPIETGRCPWASIGAQQPVGVLVGAALPRTVRTTTYPIHGSRLCHSGRRHDRQRRWEAQAEQAPKRPSRCRFDSIDCSQVRPPPALLDRVHLVCGNYPPPRLWTGRTIARIIHAGEPGGGNGWLCAASGRCYPWDGGAAPSGHVAWLHRHGLGAR